MRPLTRLIALSVALAVTAAASVAAAEDVDEFIALAEGMATVAEGAKGNCDGLSDAIGAYLDANEAKIKETGTSIRERDARMSSDQETKLSEAFDRFKAATDGCPDAGFLLLGLLAPLLEDKQPDAAELSDLDLGIEAVKSVAEGALTYYQEEHVAGDGLEVFTRVFPASAKVCGKEGAGVWTLVYAEGLASAATDRGLELCYVSSADAKIFATHVIIPGQKNQCMSGAVDMDGAPRLTGPINMSRKECFSFADGQPGEAPPMAKAEDVKPAAKRTTRKAAAKKSKPSPAEVEAMCYEWELSVSRFGKDCSALGKRLQRHFKKLTFKLADVPRYGDYRKALKRCKAANEAASSCASNAEIKAAKAVIGEL